MPLLFRDLYTILKQYGTVFRVYTISMATLPVSLAFANRAHSSPADYLSRKRKMAAYVIFPTFFCFSLFFWKKTLLFIQIT